MLMLVGDLQAADPPDVRREDVTLPHMGILLFGDSVDFRIPKYLCNVALGLEPAVFNRDNTPDPHHFAGARQLPRTWLAA